MRTELIMRLENCFFGRPYVNSVHRCARARSSTAKPLEKYMKKCKGEDKTGECAV